MNMLDAVTTRCGISLRRASGIMGISRSNHNRWKKRAARNVPLVEAPGPRKMAVADIEAITRDIRTQHHGNLRTNGSNALYRQYHACISRRDLQALIRDERARAIAECREGYDEVHWQGAGIVWSMDDTRYPHHDAQGRELWIHHVRDIGARYSFQPMTGADHACGVEVAANLHALCHRYGAPLFMKRDNGGNLNTPDVDEVLALFCVIPFNSPICTPTYNGSMERSQATLKKELAWQLAPTEQWYTEAAEPFARAAAHEINHLPLPSLNGSCACHFRTTNIFTYSKKERKDIYDWITNARISILENDLKRVTVQTAQRWAVTAWLLKNGLITINRH